MLQLENVTFHGIACICMASSISQIEYICMIELCSLLSGKRTCTCSILYSVGSARKAQNLFPLKCVAG